MQSLNAAKILYLYQHSLDQKLTLLTFILLYMFYAHGTYGLRSQDTILVTVPQAQTELGKKAFTFSAP